MVRTQIQLAEEDLARLRKVAAEEGVSVSEVVRRGIRQVLGAAQTRSRDELARRALGAAGKFRSGKHDIARRHDEYLSEEYGR